MKKLVFIAIAIFGLTIITFGQTVPSYVPTTGLVGWWPFNGNAIDESVNTNDGMVNGATLTADRFGNTNSAYSTSTGYIMCSNIAIPTTHTMSISFWYNTSTDSYNSEIISLGTTGNSTWGCLVSNGLFILNYGRGCSGTGVSPINASLTYGNWHHIVFVSFGHSNPSKIFHDGIKIGTYPSNTSAGCSNNSLNFGLDFYFNTLYNGKLDDIGIWNRALDSCEINELYFASLGNCNVGINEVSQSNLFSIYPSPANSQINVKADAKLLGSVYNVYDNTGKLALSGKINSENTIIELGNLSGGIYLFSIGENLKQTFKVIKE